MIRIIAVLAILSPRCGVRAQEPDGRAAEIEALALRALATGAADNLEAVAKEVRALKPAALTGLPLRIRPDAVEFRFRGEFRADQFSAEMLEYLISDPGHDYESLLIASPEERARLKKVGQAVEALKKAGARAEFDYKLAWTDDGRARVEDVQDILGLLNDTERKAYLNQLVFNDYGLGGSMNVKANTAVLPARRTAVELLLTVRPAKGQHDTLWQALAKALPKKDQEIDVYAENPSLTVVVFRSQGAILMFSLRTGKVEEVPNVKTPARINRITFEKGEGRGEFVLWHNGQRELAIKAGD